MIQGHVGVTDYRSLFELGIPHRLLYQVPGVLSLYCGRVIRMLEDFLTLSEGALPIYLNYSIVYKPIMVEPHN